MIRGNWGDEERENALVQLEIGLPGARADAAELVEVVLEDTGARFAGAAAAVSGVEHAGVIRPSWFVHGGARVRVEVEVPESAPELRWHDGAAADVGPRVVRVIDDGEVRELARSAGASDWRHRRASLSAWAGRRVVIELASLGEGVGLFGDPRVLSAREQPGPVLLVYLIDTLRADRLGAWGSRVSGVSPQLDRLASEGVVLRNAISSSSWTKPAIPTLMTGIWPTTHQVGATSYADRLPASVGLVQEAFRRGGWRTGSFAANPLGSTLSGLERGFGTAVPPRYWEGRVGRLGHPAAPQLHETALAWLDEEPDRPAFAYVHTLEVHRYKAPMYAQPTGSLQQPYDAAIRDADARLGELLEALRTRGRISELLLVVVSDHGHSFGEHGLRGHGRSVFQTEIHIPLLFWAPGRLEPAAVSRPVGLPDLAPTLVELAGLPPLPEADGRSLAPVLREGREPEHDFVAAALLRYVHRPEAPQQFAVLSPELRKLVRTAVAKPWRFDIAADPGEVHGTRRAGRPAPGHPRGLAARPGGRRGGLPRAPRKRSFGGPRRGRAERLRALGYLE